MVGITTLSRSDHSTAQTREYHCTKEVLPQVLARGMLAHMHLLVMYMYAIYSCTCLSAGLHVTEVAHDFQQQVRRYITEELCLLNSYDTWHGEVACM